MRKLFLFATLLLCNTLIAQLPSNVPSAGLIGYWPYLGNPQDQSINKNHGNVDGATLVPDRFGNINSAYSFNGVSNNIIVPYNTTQHLVSSFTFSGWLKNDLTQPDFQSIFLRQGGEGTRWDKTWLLMRQTNDGSTEIRVYNEHSYYTLATFTQSNEWYHLAVTIEGSIATMYRNGVLIGTGDIGYPLTYTPASMKFGMAGSGNQLYYYKGELDDVGIWDRVLSQEEILKLYNPVAPECTTPVAVTIPQTKILNYPGIAFNTVYPAYAPTSSLTLVAQVTGNASEYEYEWSTGATTQAISVRPTSNTTYTVDVIEKATGCKGTATIEILVKDVSCGNGKIQVCHLTSSDKNESNAICIDPSGVLAHLQHGCSLGECANEIKAPVRLISARIFPNPSSSQFTLTLQSDDASTAIHIRVTDNTGNTIEIRNNLLPNSSVQIGSNYRPGNYFIELVQGSAKQQLKVLKTGN